MLFVCTQEWVSQASATQRTGRAGRVCEGLCFRLIIIEHTASLEHEMKLAMESAQHRSCTHSLCPCHMRRCTPPYSALGSRTVTRSCPRTCTCTSAFVYVRTVAGTIIRTSAGIHSLCRKHFLSDSVCQLKCGCAYLTYGS